MAAPFRRHESLIRISGTNPRRGARLTPCHLRANTARGLRGVALKARRAKARPREGESARKQNQERDRESGREGGREGGNSAPEKIAFKILGSVFIDF
jgi:hypothetical protein